jgi:hypothetical protein
MSKAKKEPRRTRYSTKKPSSLSVVDSTSFAGEYALAEQNRQILVDEQDHQIDLATALGEEVPDLTGGPKRRT